VPVDAAALEAFRVAYLGKKGHVTGYFSDFKSVPAEEKKQFGQWVNTLKQAVEDKLEHYRDRFSSQSQRTGEDVTRPAVDFTPGAFHPITLVRNEIVRILERMGFAVAEGPEMEDDWHNFSALNFPEDHPARDMQDTFFLARHPDWALRTHTSSIQVRSMAHQEPPIRIIAPGRVFRNEAISSRSHCVFHQIEGLYIDKNVSFADLKQTLLEFARAFFGEKTQIRLRPSYFPFTEPSAEVDIWWGLENEVDYRMTKGTGWLEIMGCGMVDPAVLESSGIDPEVYSGFAFGMGIERIAMQRFQIPDIRAFYENDTRFLRAFQGAL
jgi:phenylalanyl-tRNA synthetase alpha chain